jgi:hypothetical protein
VNAELTETPLTKQFLFTFLVLLLPDSYLGFHFILSPSDFNYFVNFFQVSVTQASIIITSDSLSGILIFSGASQLQ